MRKTMGATSAVVLAWALASACGEDEATVSDVPEAGVDGGDRDARSASDAADDAGIIDASDAAIDADDADSGCVPGVPCGPTNINRAFVTSTTHVLGALGGLAGADAICNQRAAAAGLDGTYVAWLSSSTASAASRLANASGWVRTDGKPFAKSRGDLLAGRLLYPLELDETGTRRRADGAMRGLCSLQPRVLLPGVSAHSRTRVTSTSCSLAGTGARTSYAARPSFGIGSQVVSDFT